MLEFFRNLFDSSSFMPHGHCYLWQSDILGLTVLGDGLTGVAYFTLPLMLFYIVKKRVDLMHRNVFILFGTFIMACGTTHFIDIWTIWQPTYRLAGTVTFITGIISIISAVALYKAVPQILTIPSNRQLEEANKLLLAEIAKKENAQAELRQVNDELEMRVQRRTAQLIRLNRELEKEIEVRKEAERNLINKNGELIRINGDLDNFVYCASHDLKTPIVNAEGLVTALREEVSIESPQVNELFIRLDGSVQQMHRTIQDLSDVSALQKVSNTTHLKSLPLSAVLNEVKTDLAENIRQTKTQIITDFRASDAVWFTHKNLKSVLYNLISNAIKYHSSERTPVIKISTEDAGDYILLTVADNGIGIDLKKHEKKIFSLFKRLQDNVEGSGVGLFIVKRIMENSQGRVEVESQVGKGSAFKLYFQKRTTPDTYAG
ncbi:MAG: hypothetical protein COW65_16350 [Cytophagales bacterium CG18_big_fil_WC_8_21_14_2_50_42_9]|nr:MAG: hypothetical protein COW65_16350 [Cytophagales bacterium CG18_big_fil_WC_8_21_14_2_50_42_9]